MRRVIADLIRTELTEARAAVLTAPVDALRQAAASVSAAEFAEAAAAAAAANAAALDASEGPAALAAAAAAEAAGGARRLHQTGDEDTPTSAPRFPGLNLDWTMALPDIKDQRDCAACWAFAATGVLEAARYVSRGELTSMSDQQLIDCNFNTRLGNWGCDGGWARAHTDGGAGTGTAQ